MHTERIPIHYGSLIPIRSVFNVAISCLTTSSLPLLLSLSFQVPMQYHPLQLWSLPSLSDASTAKHHFCFGPATSYLLDLLVIALCSSPVAYQTPSNLRRGWSGIISFCLFIPSIGFWQQEFWSGLPFLSLVDHVFSELFTMTCPSWVVLHGMAHSFIDYSSLFTTIKLWPMRRHVYFVWMKASVASVMSSSLWPHTL